MNDMPNSDDQDRHDDQTAHPPLPSDTPPRILLISAMQEELDPLWEWNHPRFAWSDLREHGDAIWYRSCLHDGYEFISACAGEMGLTATSILQAKLILQWRPILVVMIGICGGLQDAGIEISDVIFSTAALQYQTGKLLGNKLISKVREVTAKPELIDLVRQFIAAHNGEMLVESELEQPATKPKLFTGAYASADLVVKDSQKFDEALRAGEDVKALDMEGFAAMYTAQELRVPFGSLIVKSVSDHATKDKSKLYREFVKFSSTYVAVKFLIEAFTPWHKQQPPQVVTVPNIRSSVGQRSDPRILVICGEQSAFEYLKRSRLRWKSRDMGDSYPQPVLTTHIRNVSVVATSLLAGRTGLVEGAMRTTMLVRYWQPTMAILIGSCGGFKDFTKLGDLVIASRAFHYQFGGFKESELQAEIRSIDLIDRIRGYLQAISASYVDDLVKRAYAGFKEKKFSRKPLEIPSWHIQPIASSDLFIRDAAQVGRVILKDRKTIAVDMEGYAFMRSIQHQRLPLGGLIIRTVANHADILKGRSVTDYANYSSAYVTAKLLHKLVDVVSATNDYSYSPIL
jgi:nucleoside phosphorylase